jgi:hypothetical protein
MFQLETLLKPSEDVEMQQRTKISIAITAMFFSTIMIAPGAIAASPTNLTTAQKAEMKYLIEEEKLARDVYTFLSKTVTTRKFSNISRSEQTHMDYMKALLTKYKISNPTSGKAAGVFVNKNIQALYNSLTAEGSAGLLQAVGVGVKIENVDIATLKGLLAKPLPVDVKAALSLMLAASYNHLEAYTY